ISLRHAWFSFGYSAPTVISTLSLHDALPISGRVDAAADSAARSAPPRNRQQGRQVARALGPRSAPAGRGGLQGCALLLFSTVERSEEHTSELQSRENLVCRLLLEKKKKTDTG